MGRPKKKTSTDGLAVSKSGQVVSSDKMNTTMTIYNKGRRTWPLPGGKDEIASGETKTVSTEWGEKMLRLYPREFVNGGITAKSSGDISKLKAENKKLRAENAKLKEEIENLEARHTGPGGKDDDSKDGDNDENG